MDSIKSNEKKIYVSNIPKHVDSKQLQLYFETFGSVYSAVVIGAKKGKSLSYGFVSFSSKKSLDSVLSSEHLIDGCKLSVDSVSIEKAKNNLVKYANGEDTNVFLFVQDIPKDVNRALLVEHFSQFGDLTKARLVSRPDKNKDFIYLQYKGIDSAATAKSQKHRIPGLSRENITLVCKVGIFRNQKQILIMEEAEDLLNCSRKQTGITGWTGTGTGTAEDSSNGRITNLSQIFATSIISEGDNGIRSERPTIDLVDLNLDAPRPFSKSSLAFTVEPHSRASLCHCMLNESEENYRFNLIRKAIEQELDRIESASEDEDSQEEFTRGRADKHITLADILGVLQEEFTETPPHISSVGAIGSGRNTVKTIPDAKLDQKPTGAFGALASAFKGLGQRFSKTKKSNDQ